MRISKTIIPKIMQIPTLYWKYKDWVIYWIHYIWLKKFSSFLNCKKCKLYNWGTIYFIVQSMLANPGILISARFGLVQLNKKKNKYSTVCWIIAVCAYSLRNNWRSFFKYCKWKLLWKFYFISLFFFFPFHFSFYIFILSFHWF